MAVIRKGLWNSPTLQDRKGGGNISGQLIEEIFSLFLISPSCEAPKD
jgi:hypothetical protein